MDGAFRLGRNAGVVARVQKKGRQKQIRRPSRVLAKGRPPYSCCGTYTFRRSACNFVRPRLIRLFTVPIGRPVISAISS